MRRFYITQIAASGKGVEFSPVLFEDGVNFIVSNSAYNLSGGLVHYLLKEIGRNQNPNHNRLGAVEKEQQCTHDQRKGYAHQKSAGYDLFFFLIVVSAVYQISERRCRNLQRSKGKKQTQHRLNQIICAKFCL